MKFLSFVALIVLALSMIACGGPPKPVAQQPAPPPPTTAPVPTPAPSPAPVTQPVSTVAFLGDSTTARWDLNVYFPGKQYSNAGVPSDNTTQMTARFQADVVAVHPDAVMVWGGTNDVWQIPPAQIEAQLQQLYDMALSNHITPIACTIPPHRISLATTNPQIVQVNAWIRQYAKDHSMQLADYYSVTVDANGELRADYAADGVHLNGAGYTAITPLAQTAIAAARTTP